MKPDVSSFVERYQLIYEKSTPTSIFLAQKPASKFEGAKPTVESWD
jgi:hypothetical protein